MRMKTVAGLLLAAFALLNTLSLDASPYLDSYLRTHYVAGDARTRW